MKSRECVNAMITCCPLCQSEEYLISEDGEKFMCGKCGFTTQQLSGIESMMHNEKPDKTVYIHFCANTVH